MEQPISTYEEYVAQSEQHKFQRVMDFGDALRLLKAGKRVSREGWNGKGLYLYYVPENSYPAVTPTARAQFGGSVPYAPYVALYTPGKPVSTWAPSISDALAVDWMEV